MSSVSVRYICSNCGKSTKENNMTRPKQCSLCNKVICHHCSPMGFCETCMEQIPQEGRTILNKGFAKKKRFTIMLWVYIAILFISLAMVILAGGTEFQENNPNASTIQVIGIILGLLSFIGACPVGLLSMKMVKKIELLQVDVAIMVKKDSKESGIEIPNVGTISDDALFEFVSKINRELKYGPKIGIDEIVQNLARQNITPAREDFIINVKNQVSARFKKAKDHGKAIAAFMVITSLMKLLSRVEGKPYSTMEKLPQDIQNFLNNVMNISDASRIAKKLILG